MSFMLRWSGHVLDLNQRTCIMGILNVTPDSFSDGGRYFRFDKAVEHGLEMAGSGADIIDVGGESTRPYSQRISANEEIDRVTPIIEALAKELAIPLSIDTYKSEVAQEALKAGASMINDISAFRFDPNMASIAAGAGVPVILMHMKGTPQYMQDNPVYENLMPEIINFFQDAIKRSVKAGVKEDLIILDPGIGFGKTFDDNIRIIRELSVFASLQRPILLGTSNKAFIGHILDKESHERDTGTMATVAAGVMAGAHIVRVHNVQKALETVRTIDAIKRGKIPDS
ncbi:MAG: dihydropteroate synthase [Thermodesulfobacteriota bacterium]|nr:dihydropteroate synthase [Thermodesulfobacteriota bacterium]